MTVSWGKGSLMGLEWSIFFAHPIQPGKEPFGTKPEKPENRCEN